MWTCRNFEKIWILVNKSIMVVFARFEENLKVLIWLLTQNVIIIVVYANKAYKISRDLRNTCMYNKI